MPDFSGRLTRPVEVVRIPVEEFMRAGLHMSQFLVEDFHGRGVYVDWGYKVVFPLFDVEDNASYLNELAVQHAPAPPEPDAGPRCDVRRWQGLCALEAAVLTYVAVRCR